MHITNRGPFHRRLHTYPASLRSIGAKVEVTVDLLYRALRASMRMESCQFSIWLVSAVWMCSVIVRPFRLIKFAGIESVEASPLARKSIFSIDALLRVYRFCMRFFRLSIVLLLTPEGVWIFRCVLSIRMCRFLRGMSRMCVMKYCTFMM